MKKKSFFFKLLVSCEPKCIELHMFSTSMNNNLANIRTKWQWNVSTLKSRNGIINLREWHSPSCQHIFQRDALHFFFNNERRIPARTLSLAKCQFCQLSSLFYFYFYFSLSLSNIYLKHPWWMQQTNIFMVC